MEVRPTAEPDLVLRVSFIVSCVEAPEWPAQGHLRNKTRMLLQLRFGTQAIGAVGGDTDDT